MLSHWETPKIISCKFGHFEYFNITNGQLILKDVKVMKNHEEPRSLNMLIQYHTPPGLRIDHQIAIRVETGMCSRIGSWFKSTATICTGPTLPNDMGPDGLAPLISLVKCEVSILPHQGTTFRDGLGVSWGMTCRLVRSGFQC